MKTVALAVRFLLELAAFAALVYAGVAIVGGGLGWLVGVVAAAIAITLWGLFVAPKARFAVGVPIRFLVELVVFAAAALGLVFADQPSLAIVLAGLYVLDRVALGLPLYGQLPTG